MADLLVVDDEHTILESIKMFLSEKGHTIHTASTIEEGIARFKQIVPEVVILDIRFPDGNGLDTLDQIRTLHPLTKVIMITAFQDMETTIESMKRGAYDYIHKPLDADELEKAVNDAIASFREDTKTDTLKTKSRSYLESEIVGKSQAMKEVYKMIGMLCQNRATALIIGETGTGKELVARRLHLSSPYKSNPFITFDCSAVVDTLLESELFGHEKGAFTGAVNSKPGKIELAGNGTLFLDEVGELPLNLQGNLLGFLERKKYMRVGGNTLKTSTCRIIAATNRDLSQMVKDKKFRDDLYFRLRVVTITLPPLRSRLSDIKELVTHFIQKSARQLGIEPMILQNGCIERLQCHPWTGNVRELENIILSACIQSRGNVILLDTIENLLSKGDHTTHEKIHSQALSQMESEHILRILETVKWNKTNASKILEISLPTLRKKIQKYNLTPAK